MLTEKNIKKLKSKEKKKQKEKELLNFYSFQVRESKKECKSIRLYIKGVNLIFGTI